jgi:hypothetical protein
MIEDAVRMAPYLKPTYVRSESELILTKWPDYAFLTPFEANLVFARTYNECYKRLLASDYDEDAAERASGVDLKRLYGDSQLINQVAGLRHFADRYGLPYEWFIDFCLKFYSRRERKRPPFINQLGPTAKSDVVWRKAFDESLRQFRESPFQFRIEDARYRKENFRGLPNQIALKQALLDAARPDKSGLQHAVRQFVYLKGLLDLDELAAVFPPDEVQRVDEVVRSEIATTLPVVECQKSIIPGCLGYVNQVGPADLCRNCPFFEDCQQTVAQIQVDLSTAGRVDRATADRRKAAEKKRRQRQKQKSFPEGSQFIAAA